MLNIELVEEIAKTSRLELTDAEKKELLKEMSEILDHFKVIEEFGDGKMSIQPVELKNHLREDKIGKCLTQDQALSQTELKKDGYFLGPKSI